jgi:hypothetical protein
LICSALEALNRNQSSANGHPGHAIIDSSAIGIDEKDKRRS